MKLVKKLLVIVFVLVLLVVGGVIFAISRIDSIAKTAIEKGGTYATGTQTTVSEVNIGLLSGKFALSGLNIANPPGFKAPHFLSLGSGGVEVSSFSMQQETIELPRFALDTITVSLEKRDGKTNYNTILDNLNKLRSTDGKPAANPPEGKDTRVIIRDLDLKNITVTVDLAGGPDALSELTRITIPIEQIKLTDVGKTGDGVAGSGVTVSELASIIVTAVLNAAAANGGGVLPADMLGDLQGRLALLTPEGLKTEVIAGAQAKVEELGKKVTDEATKVIDDAAKKATDKLKGLIPGSK